MAYSEKFTCDICGVERTASNHWFNGQGAILTSKSIVIVPFSEVTTKSDSKFGTIVSLCGESCVSKWVSENLSSLYPPAATPLTSGVGTSCEETEEKEEAWRSND